MSSTAVEMHLPTNQRSRLASSLLAALQFAPGVTDFIMHTGQPIFVKSAKGMLPLHKLGVPAADFKVEDTDFRQFFASFVSGASTAESANEYWEAHVVPALKDMRPINRSIPAPGGSAASPASLRLSLLQHSRGKLGMVIRLVLPPPPLETLGLPAQLMDRLQSNPRGLLVITGPTASGKTRTAMSILDWLNTHSTGAIESVEDPIEVLLKNDGCVITQREVGRDVPSFGAGLEEALRHAPDAILAGEVRDQDAARTAILGGESGALMMVTTHGRSIPGTLRKIIALCGDSDAAAMRTVLAGSLIGVVRQELVPHSDGAGYSMVHDTLLGTEAIAKQLSRGEWSSIEAVCARDQSGEGFYSMAGQLTRLVHERRISPGIMEQVMGARGR